jgi:Ca-activated chloride channel family protein
MADFPYASLRQMVDFYKNESRNMKILQPLLKKTWRKIEQKSNSKLQSIYDEINKLETTEIEELKFYDYDEKIPCLVVDFEWHY